MPKRSTRDTSKESQSFRVFEAQQETKERQYQLPRPLAKSHTKRLLWQGRAPLHEVLVHLQAPSREAWGTAPERVQSIIEHLKHAQDQFKLNLYKTRRCVSLSRDVPSGQSRPGRKAKGTLHVRVLEVLHPEALAINLGSTKIYQSGLNDKKSYKADQVSSLYPTTFECSQQPDKSWAKVHQCRPWVLDDGDDLEDYHEEYKEYTPACTMEVKHTGVCS